MLFQVYVFCLVFGGIFVVLSTLSGLGDADADLEADADADVDADFDADADVDADLDADFDAGVDADIDADAGDVDFQELPFEFDVEGTEVEGAEAGSGSVGDVETPSGSTFNPLTSFKFWTFGMAFFGLTGFIFEQFGLWNSTVGVLVLSLGMGVGSGLAISYLLHLADQGGGDSIGERDYLGASGEVVVPIGDQRPGEVRMQIRGRTIEVLAEPWEEGRTFEKSETCFVLGVDEGTVQVVDAETVESELKLESKTS